MPSQRKAKGGQQKAPKAPIPARNLFEALALDEECSGDGQDEHTQLEKINEYQPHGQAAVPDQAEKAKQDVVDNQDTAAEQNEGFRQKVTYPEKPEQSSDQNAAIEPDKSITPNTTPQQDSTLPLSPLLELPGEIKNKIYYFAIMLPSSRHILPDKPGPPSFRGTTHLLRVNHEIHDEAGHLLRDKPNRVTLNVWQPMTHHHYPLLAACKTQHSSWASRAYTFQQVSRMDDLTIRIPYFEWATLPQHHVNGPYDPDVDSQLGFRQEAGDRHLKDIQRQLYIVAAAASHNPSLGRLTLAFRRWKGEKGQDKAYPDHARIKELHKTLEPLVRFRGIDIEVRAVSYELPSPSNKDRGREEVLAPWFNAMRADWEYQMTDKIAGFELVEASAASKKKDKKESTWGIQTEAARRQAYLTPTSITEFDGVVPGFMLEHGVSAHKDECCQVFGTGQANYCVLCHRDLYTADAEKPGKIRRHGEDGDECVGPCAVGKDGVHEVWKSATDDESEW